MRLHRTYILRLLVDTETSGPPPELRGALQAIEDPQTYPFKSGTALLSLLQALIRAKTKDDDEQRSLVTSPKPGE